ncbi:MAG: redoxin domain-containing protein [Bacteroidota bacterium]
MRVHFLIFMLLGSTAAAWAVPSPEAILNRSHKALQSIHQVYFEVVANSQRTKGKNISAQLWAYRAEADTATPWDNVLILSDWADWRWDGNVYQSALHVNREVHTSANDPRLEGFRKTKLGPASLFMLKEFFDPDKMVTLWRSFDDLQVFEEGDSWVIGAPFGDIGYRKLYFRKSDYLPWKRQEGFIQSLANSEVTITFLDIDATQAPQTIADFQGWPDYLETDANEPPRPSATLLVGDTAPAWELPNFDEQAQSLDALAGNHVLLIMWQEDCRNCRRALAEVNTWKGDFAEKDLNILSMIGAPSTELKEQLTAETDPIYSHLLLDRTTQDAYAPNKYPFFCVIDQEGTIQYMDMGYNQAYVRQWLMDNLD